MEPMITKKDLKKIILIDSNPSFLTNLVKILEPWKLNADVEVHTFTSPANALLFLDKYHSKISVIVIDFGMTQVNPLEFIDRIDRKDRTYQIIILATNLNRNLTESFLHLNIFDLLHKNEPLPKIADSIKQAHQFSLKKEEQKNRFETYLQEIRKENFSQIIEDFSSSILGSSKEILSLKKQIKKIAPSSAPCLIVGESGTGKDLVARALHEESTRKQNPFVAFNCASFPKESVEAELFGYRRGAFSHATYDKQGLLELANNGTLYFDEICELPIQVQTRITNFLDDGQIQVLGEAIPKKLDVRIVASTSEDIEQAVKQGKIKHELYFRLNVIPLFLPPLRERKSDIKELFENFLNYYANQENKPNIKYDEAILPYLENYYWPGNVRELKNVVQRIVLFLEGNFVKLENIPIEILRYKELERKDDPTTTMERPVLSMREIEKRSIEKALKKANYNKELAAKTLGISRASIYRKMKEYGIE